MLRYQLKTLIQNALARLYPGVKAEVQILKPAQPQFGEFATNIALALAKILGKKPRDLAEEIRALLQEETSFLKQVSVDGPGFLNFHIQPRQWLEGLKPIFELKNAYGRSSLHSGKKVVVEFVSANPTGPLHIGNARGGPLGDVIASLFESVGYEVVREFYVNDVGGQIDQLGKTMLAWMKMMSAGQEGELNLGEGQGYKGEYVKELAQLALKELGQHIFQKSEAEAIHELGLFGIEKIQVEIRKDCLDMGIHFDSWVHEKDILSSGQTKECLDLLKSKKMTVEKEGATWFVPRDDFLQDRECVLERSDGGRPTYFANDIAYHVMKYRRGFDFLVNIWGSNHHGHVPRVQAAVQSLGYDPSRIETVLYQYVRVKRGSEAVKMSKRGGNFVLAREVLDEVGKDAFRFFLLTRSPEAHLDFDLELAKSQSHENPVYYVQYAHARICSIFEKASSQGTTLSESFNLSLLDQLGLPEEIALAQLMLYYPLVVLESAEEKTPHRLTYYLQDLARAFQHYYDRARSDVAYRVITENKPSTEAKLFFMSCIRQVLRNGLHLLGLSAPEKM